jgi:large subunit ribosomal protein L23
MLIDLVKNVVLTEKSVRLIENNQYTFDVDMKLTKPKIKKIIEEFFDVKVSSVNTHRLPSSSKKRSKRVIVTVKPGYSISLFPEEN